MKNLLLCVVLVGALGCGKKSDSGPDVTKMSPVEACRVIGKRALECKDTIAKVLSAEMKKQGASDKDVEKMTGAISQPMACSEVKAEDIDPMITCYDHDCGKLATCYLSMVQSGMEKAGGDEGHVAPDSAAVKTAEPAAASGSGSN